MTIHTTTADENGNFSINIGTALTSGETIEVTAQKDDQSKKIVIQAPSEPYLPPKPIETSTPIPMNMDFATLILQGRKILVDGDGATVVTEDNVSILTNTYYRPDEAIALFQAAKIDLEYYKSLSDTENLLKMRQGQVMSNGSVNWFGDGFFITKAEAEEALATLTGFTLDKSQVYFLLPNTILFNSELNFDEADNHIYEITVDGVSHIYRTNKNYVESN